MEARSGGTEWRPRTVDADAVRREGGVRREQRAAQQREHPARDLAQRAAERVGVADAVAAATARGVHVDVRPGAGVLKPSSAPHVFPELQTVSDKWSSRVRGKSSCLQFTVVLEPDSEGSKVKKWDLPAS